MSRPEVRAVSSMPSWLPISMTRLRRWGSPVASALTAISVPTPDGSPIATASNGLEFGDKIAPRCRSPFNIFFDHAIDRTDVAIAGGIDRAQGFAAFERVERFEEHLAQDDDRAIG